MDTSIRVVADNEPVQIALGDSRFEFEPTPNAEHELATKADVERLEAKIDFMIQVFENLGETFEDSISEFMNGPMGKLFGKLAGKASG